MGYRGRYAVEQHRAACQGLPGDHGEEIAAKGHDIAGVGPPALPEGGPAGARMLSDYGMTLNLTLPGLRAATPLLRPAML